MMDDPAPAPKPEAFRVLIIDDTRAARLVIRNFMREFGFETDEAPDGAEAIRLLSTGKIVHLIICDWEMPVMTGLEFVRAYRGSSLPSHSETPILMATSANTTEKIEEALNAGATDYLMKPFTKEMFASKLDLLGIEHK